MQLSFSVNARFVAIAICITLVVGCDREISPSGSLRAEPFAVFAEPAQLTIPSGSTGWLAAQVNDSSGQPIGGASVRFEAPDPKLLRVNGMGEVTALGPAGRSAVRITSGAREITVPVTIVASAPSRIEILRGAQAMTAGLAPESPLVARLLDDFGNPVGATRIAVDIDGNAATDLTTVTDPEGSMHIPIAAVERAGMINVRVHTMDSASPVSSSVDVHVAPAAAAVLTRIEGPTGDAALVNAEYDVALRVEDAFGNAVPGVLVRFDPGIGISEPPESLSSVDGMVRTHWKPSAASRSATLRASAADKPEVMLELTANRARKKR